MTHVAKLTFTVVATLLLTLACIEPDPAEDGPAGSPGSGETGFELAVVATAPFPDASGVPHAEPFLLFRTNLPVADAADAVSLERGAERVPVSVVALTDEEPFITRVTPLGPLAPDTDYALRVRGGADGLRSIDGADTLPHDVVIRFRTRGD